MPDRTDDVEISHLQRRKIEGRVLIPFIEAAREKFGDAATRELVVATIRRLAIEDGARWAEAHGHSLAALKAVAEKVWAGGGSLDVEIVAASDDRLDFNVTRCRYAEFYQELGLAELGPSRPLQPRPRDDRGIQSRSPADAHADRDGRRHALRLPLHQEAVSGPAARTRRVLTAANRPPPRLRRRRGRRPARCGKHEQAGEDEDRDHRRGERAAQREAAIGSPACRGNRRRSRRAAGSG